MTATPSGPVSIQTLRALDRGVFERWVRRGILVTTCGYGVALIADLSILSARAAPFAAASELTVVAAGAVALALVRAGRIQGAALLLLTAVWLEQHTWIFRFGVPSTALVVFPVVVAVTGMILGGRAAFVLSGVSTLTIAGTGLLAPAVRAGAGTSPGQGVYWVLMTSACMFATAAFVKLGVDALGRALMVARSNERRLADVLDHAPAGVVATDSDGIVLTLNPAAEEILGFPVTDVRGRRLQDVLGEAWVGEPESWNLAELLARGQGEATALRFGDDPEHPRWVDVSLGRVPWADGTNGFQIIVRDVTAQRDAEENRQLLRTQLEQAQRLEAVGRLAGGVAHEFNNILTSIGVAAELLVEDGRGEILELARQVKAAQVRGADLTRQLLAFARLGITQLRMISVQQTILDMEPFLRKTLGDGVELELDLDWDGEVLADRAQLEQVVLNLVLNGRTPWRVGEGSPWAWLGRGRREAGRTEPRGPWRPAWWRSGWRTTAGEWTPRRGHGRSSRSSAPSHRPWRWGWDSRRSTGSSFRTADGFAS